MTIRTPYPDFYKVKTGQERFWKLVFKRKVKIFGDRSFTKILGAAVILILLFGTDFLRKDMDKSRWRDGAWLERCVDVMAGMFVKYGPGVLEKHRGKEADVQIDGSKDREGSLRAA
ncbi:MAG: hypothetical protein LUI12_01210 [Clostridiales bacterium]|nr:hypothetical protein [Clostridiales bacterium]